MADDVSSRRNFMKLAGLAGMGLMLDPVETLAISPAPAPHKATKAILILADAHGQIKPIDIDVTAMPEIPKGFEWAKGPVSHLIDGFKAIRENERKIIGTTAVFENYIRDGGVLAVCEDGKFNGKPVPGDSAYSRLPYKDTTLPIITFDARRLNAVPKNAGFYTAHELAHHLNYEPGVFRAFTPEQVEDAGARAVIHSAHPLFGIAVNLDFADLQHKHTENQSLLTFTQRRAAGDPSMADQFQREKEFLSDAVGVVLSGVNPDFPLNAEFTNQQKAPLVSPLVKRYVEDVFMYDMTLRKTPTPSNNLKREKLYNTLVDPKHILGDEAAFRYVTGLEEKIGQREVLSQQELSKCEAILGKTLDSFKEQRNAQMGTPGRP